MPVARFPLDLACAAAQVDSPLNTMLRIPDHWNELSLQRRPEYGIVDQKINKVTLEGGEEWQWSAKATDPMVPSLL